MGKSDRVVIEFALPTSLTTLIPTRLVKHYRTLDAEKALEMASNLPWTYPLEGHNDINIDWRLPKTNILVIDEHYGHNK